MRALLLVTIHAALVLVAFLASLLLAFALAEGYFILSGGVRSGEIIGFWDRPALPLGELGIKSLAYFAIVCLVFLARNRLNRWSRAAPPDASAQPDAEEKAKTL